MATTSVHDFLITFRDQLKARANLSGVQITTGPMGQYTRPESIQLMAVDHQQQYGATGNKRQEEEYEVNGAVWVRRDGNDEAAIEACRKRAQELYSEVLEQLRADHRVSTKVNLAFLARASVDQGASPDGRWCMWMFIITVRNSIVNT